MCLTCQTSFPSFVRRFGQQKTKLHLKMHMLFVRCLHVNDQNVGEQQDRCPRCGSVGVGPRLEVCLDKVEHNARIDQVGTPRIAGVGTEQSDQRSGIAGGDSVHEVGNGEAAQSACHECLERFAAVRREIVFEPNSESEQSVRR